MGIFLVNKLSTSSKNLNHTHYLTHWCQTWDVTLQLPTINREMCKGLNMHKTCQSYSVIIPMVSTHNAECKVGDTPSPLKKRRKEAKDNIWVKVCMVNFYIDNLSTITFV